MNGMRLGACLYGKGAVSNDNIIIIIIIIEYFSNIALWSSYVDICAKSCVQSRYERVLRNVDNLPRRRLGKRTSAQYDTKYRYQLGKISVSFKIWFTDTA